MTGLIVGLLACGGGGSSDPVQPADVAPGDTDCATLTLYPDEDGDGFGDDAAAVEVCEPEAGLIETGGDCDDTTAAVYPGAAEVCGDGHVNDCDGSLSTAAALCGVSGDVLLSEGLSGEEGAGLGASIGSGDFDSDGKADVLIGAPDGGSGAVFLAPAGALDSAMLLVEGAESRDELGAAVAGVGDVDGDGHDDALIGAPGDDTAAITAGSAWLLLGPLSGAPHAVLLGESSVDYAGSAVAGAGDVDGDGRADLLVGGWGSDTGGSSAGGAWLVLGGVSGTVSLADAAASFTGAAASDYAGAAVSSAGDIDGDGLSDLLIGARGDDTGGAFAGGAYVVRGTARGAHSLADAHLHLVGPQSNDRAGTGVVGAGDVNGDGLDDLLIGGSGSSTAGSFAGGAWLVLGGLSGTVSLTDADATLLGEDSGDYAGATVAAGDLDGDGLSDLLIGAPHDSAGASHAGGVFAVLGPVTGTVSLSKAHLHAQGTAEDGEAGSAVAAGDVDGDGLSDVLIGAPQGGIGGVAFSLTVGGY